MSNYVNYIDNITSVNNVKMNLTDVITLIKNDLKLKDITYSTRDKINDTKEYKNEKKKLPVVNFSALMKYGYIHSIVNIIEHTNILVLDYDHFNSNDDVENTYELLKKDNRVLFIYRSVSGLGLKVGVIVSLDRLISIDSDDTDIIINNKYNVVYKYTYQYVDMLFFDKVKMNADDNAKDISRCSYLAYDPNVYFNSKCDVIIVDVDKIEKSEDELFVETINEDVDVDKTYSDEVDYLVNFVRKYKIIVAENYNNWIYFSNLFTKIYPAKEALLRFHLISQLCSNYNKDEVDKKMSNISRKPINGTTNIITFYKLLADYGYKLNRENVIREIENHKITQIASELEEIEDRNVLMETPFIHDNIYSLLPPLMRDMCVHFPDKRDRDVFFTSLLVSFSAIFENVKGVYHGDELSLNLFTYIVAPPSSGKGNAKYAIQTTLGVDELLKNEYDIKVKQEIDRVNNYNDSLETTEEDDSSDNKKNKKKIKLDLTKIPKKCLNLPENISDRALFDKLDNNNGGGLMYLSETDTLVNNQHNDWAKNLTVLMRKAIHNEKADLSRKDDDSKVENVKMSMVLTSTLSTLLEFIKSENGTLSRFLFYVFDKEFVFKGGFSMPNKTQIYKNYQSEITSLYDYYRNVDVRLATEDPENFDKIIEGVFNKKYKRLCVIFNNKDFESILKRYALMTYRIAYIFQLIDFYSSRGVFDIEASVEVMLTEKYLKIALNLIQIYLKHTEVVFYNTSENKTITFNYNKNEGVVRYIKSLKTSFDAAKIKKYALDIYNIKDSVVKQILSKMVKNGDLIKENKLTYKNK